MQTENRLLEDLARVAQGAAGAFAGMREELEGRLKEHAERILARMHLVRREEFDAVQAMAAKARRAQEALESRVSALEARFGLKAKKPPAAKAKTKRRGASRSA
ncbi:MAG: accessory factor UbiK family protein [Stellaceae bacterium]|jgi:BMFP domain-containing protein YqiC